MPTLRLDATDPLERTTAALDAFRPDSLVGFASILRALADEQLAGRLAIAPRAVMSASEVLTDETRARADIAAAATCLPAIDAVVFTGGIGENSGRMRARIAASLAVLGIAVISDAEVREDEVLTDAAMTPAVLRIRAREDIVIAEAVRSVLL